MLNMILDTNFETDFEEYTWLTGCLEVAAYQVQQHFSLESNEEQTTVTKC